MRAWAASAIVAGLALAGWCWWRLQPRTLEIRPVATTARWERVYGRDVVRLPGRYLAAEIAVYDDELYAYLMFHHFRGSRALGDSEVLLTSRRDCAPVYPVELRMENDLLSSLALLAEARASGLIGEYRWRWVDGDTLAGFRSQTGTFLTAYNLASRRGVEDMSREELVGALRRFVQFKSAIDPRIRGRIEPVPRALSRAEARRMAEDIVTVAGFFELPLESFLGIGAMENNYMNVRGDLRHAVWKKRAERGDVVLKRRPGPVLVRNPSAGVWQITRETLRSVHRLYLEDKRDYSRLPERLRPPRELNLDDPDPASLTTYAGLLLRILIDRFEGDVGTAVGAYNGGPGNPNPRYARGVLAVADHARTVLRQAAALDGQPAAGRRFLRSGG